jgi:hypothetical protein
VDGDPLLLVVTPSSTVGDDRGKIIPSCHRHGTGLSRVLPGHGTTWVASYGTTGVSCAAVVEACRYLITYVECFEEWHPGRCVRSRF